ncbi:uncharacterized protein LOC132045550 [Lycium ferocissimum]|uniref:uncharacterized protein LOC132045550 n=1 Tax=Lycium ferocissimum TaxID=112874 RepID=UPI002815C2A3|nr:uncharacterized protein LOC132045550 [Lycium ferocissimum]
MAEAIQLLTQLVAALVQRQDVDLGDRTDGMTIARIQAHAQNLEEQQQSQKSECDSDRGRSKKARSSGAGSKYKRGQRQQYSRRGQSSRVLGSPSGGAPRQTKSSIPRCSQCRKFHPGPCRHGSDACYACGQIGHKMRECPSMGDSGKGQPAGSMAGSFPSVRPPGQTSQAPTGRGRERGGAPSSAGPPHRIYALTGRQDSEPSLDAATGI